MKSIIAEKILKNKNGFTLIELLVVIAIISLLSSVVFASLSSARAKARDARRLSDIKQLQLALELYYDTNGSYPSSSSAWRCLGHTDSQTCWMGDYTGLASLNNSLQPYISNIPDDPRNNTACYGDAYLYNSNVTVGSQTGVFLHWYFETGEKSNKSCGGGSFGGGNFCGYYCWLYIGPSTP